VLSDYFKQQAKNYSSSHYYNDIPRGDYKGEYRSEDLCSLTFENDQFDLFITSDVFEHIMEPAKAFSVIARVLKPGGAHVFTMPWYPSLLNSVQRAKMENNVVLHLESAVYHGNPINAEGSLVTFDWGRDFTKFVSDSSKIFTTIYLEKNARFG
jgi:SAM-dependent methyltransferase